MGGDDFSKKGEGIIERAVAKASTDILAAAKKLRAEASSFGTFVTNEFFESAQVEEMVHKAIERGDNGVLLRGFWSRDAIVGAAELNDKIFQHQVKTKQVPNAEIGFFDIEAAVVDRLIREGAKKANVRKSCFSDAIGRGRASSAPIKFCSECLHTTTKSAKMLPRFKHEGSLLYKCPNAPGGHNNSRLGRDAALIIWHLNPFGLNLDTGVFNDIKSLRGKYLLSHIDREFFTLYVDYFSSMKAGTHVYLGIT